MKRVLEELRVPDKLYTPAGVLGHIDRAKNRGLGPQEIEQLHLLGPVARVVQDAYAKYQERLLAAERAILEISSCMRFGRCARRSSRARRSWATSIRCSA